MTISGREHADANGTRWKFLANGSFCDPSSSDGSYILVPGGCDIRFGNAPYTCPVLASCNKDSLKIAFSYSDVRPSISIPSNNRAVFTFRRVKE